MINILQVVPTLGYGGVAKVVRNYYDAIDHSKYHFDFVTHGGVEDYHDTLIKDGSKIYYFETIGKLGTKGYLKQITNEIKIDNYDIVHIHTGDITGIYARCFNRCGCNSIICHAHTTKAVSRSHRIFERYFRHLALKYSDLLMACGQDAGRYCFGNNRYIVLPNSINYQTFNNVKSDNVLNVKKELNIPEEKTVIGHVGIFTPQKNHSFLLKVAEKVVTNNPQVVFVLCGQGPLFEEIKKTIVAKKLDSSIILAGVRNDINILMHVFDLFVLPSLFEGLPMVGIEAQTAGLNCIFSDKIDKNVDIGCGLSSFLSIDSGEQVWVDKIQEKISTQARGDEAQIKDALKAHGYDIEETVKILSNEYDALAGCR